MNNLDQEDLEAWLVEVDLVKEKIDKLRTGEISVEQFDKQQRIKEERKKREENEKRIREEKQQQDALEAQRLGRKGNGEKKNYSHFCPKCPREYELPTEKCLHCNGPTILQSVRYNQLMEKVENLKFQKQKKEENRRQWDLQQKTQKMVWKKSSTNYKRWDYFEDSSEEEQQFNEQTLPKHDPNFQALEKDMIERKNRKIQDMKKAEELKLRGNDYIKNGQYDHAVMKYSQALELVKDVKAIWLNRALAYIKLRKFRKAISDCTKVIDYAECFEHGFEVSRESCFKAFLRRGTAFKERKDYEQAQKDAEQALVLFPKDKEALQLKKEIDQLREHNQKKREVENELQAIEIDYKTCVDQFVGKQQSDVRVTDIMDLLKCMRNQPEKAKVYFFERKGMIRLLEVIQSNIIADLSEENEQLSFRMPCLLLKVFLSDNALYQDDFIALGGVNIIMDRVENLLDLADGRERSYVYDFIEDYLELFLGMLDDDKVRSMMQNNEKLIYHLYHKLFARILRIARTEPSLCYMFINFCSNLCYGPSLFKKTLETAYKEIIQNISPILDYSPEKSKYVDLLIASCNLLSNFLSETSFRTSLVSDKIAHELIFQKIIKQLSSVRLQDNPAASKWAESALAILVNLSYQAKEETQQLLVDLRVGQLLTNHFILNEELQPQKTVHRVIISRCLQVLSKLNFSLNKNLHRPLQDKSILYLLQPFLEIDRSDQTNDYTSSILRMIMQIFTTVNDEQKDQMFQDLQDTDQLFLLLENLRGLLMNETEIIFCNACNAIGQIIDCSPLTPNNPSKNCNPSTFFHQVIPRLVTIVRDRTGNFRKNAAILLAKLTKDQRNLQALRDLHGIEILKSVIGPIIQK